MVFTRMSMRILMGDLLVSRRVMEDYYLVGGFNPSEKD